MHKSSTVGLLAWLPTCIVAEWIWRCPIQNTIAVSLRPKRYPHYTQMSAPTATQGTRETPLPPKHSVVPLSLTRFVGEITPIWSHLFWLEWLFTVWWTYITTVWHPRAAAHTHNRTGLQFLPRDCQLLYGILRCKCLIFHCVHDNQLCFAACKKILEFGEGVTVCLNRSQATKVTTTTTTGV